MTTPDTRSKRPASTKAKKETVLAQPKKSRRTVMVVAVVILILGGAAGYYGYTAFGVASPVTEAVASHSTSSTEVRYPIHMFDDGKARHFTYKADGITIGYFILKSSDGIIRAAFDACDVCWPAGKGYFQQGDTMVCRNCGRRFKSVKINEVKGGCNPAPLARHVEGDQLVIKVEDILKGQGYFDFSKRG